MRLARKRSIVNDGEWLHNVAYLFMMPDEEHGYIMLHEVTWRFPKIGGNPKSCIVIYLNSIFHYFP